MTEIRSWFAESGPPTLTIAHRALDLNKVQRDEYGSAIFNAAPARIGDYPYLAEELPGIAEGFPRDEIIIGRIEEEDMRNALPQFKGLIVTNDHWFGDANSREWLEVGRVLSAGELREDGFVHTEIVITDPRMLSMVEAGKVQLSIGFRGTPDRNPSYTRDGDEPLFFFRNLRLNHLAIVDVARAGDMAELYTENSGELLMPISMAHSAPKPVTKESKMKVSLGGREVEMDDADARALEAERAAHQQAVAERDTKVAELQGANAAHEKTIGDLKKETENSGEQIRHAVERHSKLVTDMKNIGETFEHSAGAYDPTEVKSGILVKNGMGWMKDEKNPAVIDAAFSAYVAARSQSPGAVENGVTAAHAGTKPKSSAGQFSTSLTE